MAKAFTDINQSRKLAEILPPESADMWWREVSHGFYHIGTEIPKGWYDVPPKGITCWSLAALLDYLSANFHIDIKYLDNQWELDCRIQFCYAEEIIDACVQMILNLHEQKLL